jgi:predicted NUDIX family NTP pyrophosphohydrolase
MATVSAGILMYRHGDAGLVVLLVHPGGPFWRNRDLGAWSIPKGELDDGEDPEAAARREFAEELGIEATGPLQSLGQVRQRGGKLVLAYALEGALDVSTVRSNEIAIEWPPRSAPYHIHSGNRSRGVVRASSGANKDSRQPAAVARPA